MQVRTFLSHGYVYGSIMFIFILFLFREILWLHTTHKSFLLRNLVDLLLAAPAKTKHAAVYAPVTVPSPIIILDHAHV